MKLTDAQREFIDSHVLKLRSDGGLGRRDEKRKRSAYADFLRRNAKVLAELDKLRGSDQYEQLAMEQAMAESDARDGRFEDAYRALEQVKNLARSGAKGYVDSLTYETLRRRIEELRDKVDVAMGPVDSVFTRIEKLAQEAEGLPAFPSPKPELDKDNSNDNRQRLLGDLLGAKTDFLLRLEGMRSEAQSAAKQLDDAEIPGMVERLKRQIEVAKSHGSKNQRKWLDGLDHLLDDAPTEAYRNSKLLNGAAVIAEADEAIEAAKKRIGASFDKLHKPWMAEFQARNPEDAPTDGTVGARTSKQSKTSFADAEKAYNKAIEAAIKRLAEEQKRDAEALRPDSEREKDPGYTPPTIPRAKQLKTYKIKDALPEQLIEKLAALAPPPEGSGLAPGAPPSEKEIEEAAKMAAEHVGKTLANEDAGSDVVFDLCLKDRGMFLKEIAAGLGWDKDEESWTEEQRAAGDKIAGTMAESVQNNSPNKLSNDKQSFTFNGKTYSNPKKLGAGGLCTAYRYTCDEDQTSIVMKTPNERSRHKTPEQQRSDMVTEMRAHRLAMGGENGKGNPHMVGMLGGLTDSKGGVHMLLEECASGDMDDFALAMNEASRNGALPQEARDALLRAMVGDAARGLQYVKDQGLTHNDIKGANFLIDATGTLKIADLGSGRVVDDEGKTRLVEGEEAPPMTPKYQAPEADMVGTTAKSDIFSLGAMLDVLTNPDRAKGQFYASKPDRQTMEGGQVRNTTAFERLRNAMLDDDPDKRPSIEAVLMSSYVDDTPPAEQQDFNHDVPMAELKEAIIAYGKGPAKEIAKLEQDLRDVEHEIEQDNKFPNRARFLEEDERSRDEKLREIEQLKSDPKTRQLLEAITNTAKLGSRTPPKDVLGEKPPQAGTEDLAQRFGAVPPQPGAVAG